MSHFYTLTALSWVLLLGTLVRSNEMTQSQVMDGPTPFQDWDYLVYSQRWLITACEDYEEEKKGNTCNMPQDPTTWGVHGVWPTKTGKMGPFFCDSAIHFDPEQLQPILNDLEQKWPNIEAKTKPNSFWKHEWSKHGTCASTLPQLDSVRNYFQRGLQWRQEYDLETMLAKSQIFPGDSGYPIESIYDGIRNVTGYKPVVQCDVNRETKESLISEIRICFNKSLDLIDCSPADGVGDVVVQKGDLLSNCNLKKPVMYYKVMPSPPSSFDDYDGKLDDYDEEYIQQCLENYRYQDLLLKIYGAVRFLIWFTL